jgi:hypothetical protein
MLPSGLWKGIEFSLNPLIRGFFAAGGTKPGFTGMWHFDAFTATKTSK